MYECKNTTIEEIRSNARVLVSTITINASTEHVFGILKDADSWPLWLDAIKSVTWTSPEPFGVDTTRTVALKVGGIVVNEKFYLWEENRRFSFYFSHCNRPVFDAVVEDYLLTDIGQGQCEMQWTFAVRSRGIFKPLIYLLSPILANKNAQNLQTLKRLAERNL